MWNTTNRCFGTDRKQVKIGWKTCVLSSFKIEIWEIYGWAAGVFQYVDAFADVSDVSEKRLTLEKLHHVSFSTLK